MLAALFAPAVITALFREGADLFKQYQQGQITLAQLQQQLGIIAMREATKVEQANTDMVAKTFPAFIEAVKTSRLVRIGYFFTIITQASVLAFYQIGVPWLVWEWGGTFPSPGDQLLQWCYGLLVLLLGGGIAATRRPKQPGQ